MLMVKTHPTITIMLALFIVTFLVYSRVAFFPFSVIDDPDYLYQNTQVLSGLSFGSLRWAITAFHAGNWHPLTWLSLMLDAEFFGDNPMGYHLVNAMLHALNASLLFLVFHSITGAVWRSLFVAACFALHPLHVESVAWIAERKDVLSGLFLMLVLYFYGRYVKESKKSFYLLALASFSVGLTAKAMLVTVPAILIILDIWPLERLASPFTRQGQACGIGLKALLLEKIPFVVFSVASAVVTQYAQKKSVATFTGLPLHDRMANALWSASAYLQKTAMPFDLAVFYPFTPVPFWKAAGSAVFLSLVSILVIKYRQRTPYLLAGWLWYTITLLPVIGLIQVGRQSMADRYTYLPLIGIFAAASWGGADLCARFPGWIRSIRLVAAGLLIWWTIGTWIQLGYWRDNRVLLSHAVEVTENNSFAHDCLGNAYDRQNEPDRAAAEYLTSLAIDPNNALAHYDLARVLAAQNKLPEAIAQYEEALSIDPGDAEVHFALGIVLARIGRTDDAEREFSAAIRIDPGNSIYHNNLGTLYARYGQLDAAIEQFSLALQADPGDSKAGANLETALRQKSGMGRR